MPRKKSMLAEDWWDYTTLDEKILEDAAKLTEKDLLQLSRPGFTVVFYDKIESFYILKTGESNCLTISLSILLIFPIEHLPLFYIGCIYFQA